VDRLGFTLDHAAYLQAAVAVGVVAGASAAGRWVPLRHAKRVLAAGVLMGCVISLAASLRNLTVIVLLLALIGFIGGFVIVPLNALLQHRGFALLTAGRSIAVQGFNENLSVLAMLAVYAALLAVEVPIVVTLWLLGLFVAAAIGALMLRERRRAGHFGFGGVRSRVR
jgi:MFS transporter, LPLT family, lysophospholipid transporter